MIKLYFKILMIPIVYCLLIVRALIKWLFVIPILFILFFIRHAFIWLIIGIAAAFVLTPIATAIVVLVSFCMVFSKAKEDVSFHIPRCLEGGWNYKSRAFSALAFYKAEKKRIAYEKKILKEYKKVEDEFIGFNQSADIFVSFEK